MWRDLLRAGDGKLQEECDRIGRCYVGESVISLEINTNLIIHSSNHPADD